MELAAACAWPFFLRPAGSPATALHRGTSIMRQTNLLAGLSIFALAAAAAVPAAAQTTTDRYYMPYEKDFWSYFGANIGQTKFKDTQVPTTDDKDTGFKIYGGGKFRDWLGLEIGYFNLGKARLFPE